MVIKMYCNLYMQKLELDEMNVNLYDHADLNKLIIADNENLNHFVSKSILHYILSELNHDVISDYHIIAIGNVDLYDITTRTIYQFESSNFMTNKHLTENDILNQHEVEVIIIFLEDLPDDIFQRYMKLREYITLG